MIDLGQWECLIRDGSERGARFVATNRVTADGARAAGWDVIDLRLLLDENRAMHGALLRFAAGDHTDRKGMRLAARALQGKST